MSNLLYLNDLSSISDDYLKKRLKDEFNFACGPITPTTKNLYVKKLQEFIKNTQGNSNPIEIVTTPKKRRKTLATPVAKEESPKPTRRASVGRSSPRTKLKLVEKKEIKSLSNSFKESEPEEPTPSVDKNFFSSNGTTALSYSRGNKLLKKSFSNRLASSLITNKNTENKNESLSSDESGKDLGGVGYSTKKNKKNTPKLLNKSSSITSFSDSDNEELQSKKETKSFTESFTKRLLRHRPKNTVKNQDYDYPKYLNSQNLVTQVTSNNDKNQVSDIFNTQSNYISYFILIAIVLFLVFIFSFYFFSRYYSTSSKEEAEINKLEKEFDLNIQDLMLPECFKDNETDKICSANNIRPILLIIKEIKNIINKKMNNFYCSSSENINDNPYEYNVIALRNQIELSIGPSVINLVKNKQNKVTSKDLFLSLFGNALDLLAHNSKLHLKPLGENNEYTRILVSEEYPKLLSSGCQFKLFLIKTFWYFTGLFTVSFVCFSVYLYLNHLKKQILKEKELLYELVEKSIELLQSSDDLQSLPILHIRDMLLNPSQRKSQFYQKIWDQVVNFIENNESRIKSSIENIEGEDFKTWKWVATNTNQPDSTVMKASQSDYQNNIFSDRNSKINTLESSRNISTSTPIKNSANVITSSNLRNFVALTEFLKVRNMVDQEKRKSDLNWKEKIKRSILMKCCENPLDSTSHGLQHIHIDDRNVNDGLIYIKCESIEKASNAFKALHGWWCDNKLVSVKFLKEERYYSRFPDAVNCNQPISLEDD